MKVLIVGGRGYLGSVLCNLMCKHNNVTSIDLGWFPTKLDNRVHDIVDNAFNVRDLTSFDSVICLAGISNDPVADINPSETFANNVGLTFHLAKIAKRDGVKSFIYSSSCSIYGWKDSLVTEQDLPETVSYYGTSKLLGERVSFLSSPEFRVVTFRMGTLSGVSPRMRFDLLLNTMFASLKTQGKIVVNCPDIWRPVLCVREAAKIYMKAVNEDCFNGIYNLASFNCTILDAANVMKKHFGGDIQINNGVDVRNYSADVSKIKRLANLESTLDTIAIDLKNINIVDDLNSCCYYNIKTYKEIMGNVEAV